MSVSYLSDALGDMANAALRLLHGDREATFSFEDEPGEHHWLLNRGEADSLHIRVLWFEDTFNHRRLERGVDVFACDCAVLDFVGQVSHVLQSILKDEGIKGYKQRWQNHDFPLGTFNEIQRFLSARPIERK